MHLMIVFNDTTLFVHNPKTAGTTLISFLQSTLPGPVYTGGVQQLGTYHPSLSKAMGYACGVRGHARFDRIISVIRNPFDREVSMYTYFRDVLSKSPELHINLPDAAMQRRVRKSVELEFRDYLRWLWDEEGTVDVWRSRCFYEAVEGTEMGPLKLLRFEHLDEDLSLVLNVEDIRLPKLNASERRRTPEYYDQYTEYIVRRSYDWMFAAGHYPANLSDSS